MKEQINLSKKYKFKPRDLIFGVLFIIISFYLVNRLLILFSGEDFVKTKSIIKRINIIWLFFALIFLLVTTYIRALKWKLLMNSSNYFPTIKSLFSSISAFTFANSIIPRSGLLFRSFLLKKSENIPIDFTFGTIIVERIIDTIIFGICIFFSILLNLDDFIILLKKYNLMQPKLLLSIIAVALLLLIFFIFYFKKFSRELSQISILENLMVGIKSFNKLNNKFYFIFLTLLSWIFFILFNIVITNAFDELSLSFSEILFIFTIGIFGFLIPTPGGIGSYHAAVLVGFNILGLSSTFGLAFAFVNHTFQYIIGIIVGLIGTIYSFWKEKERKKIKSTLLEN